MTNNETVSRSLMLLFCVTGILSLGLEIQNAVLSWKPVVRKSRNPEIPTQQQIFSQPKANETNLLVDLSDRRLYVFRGNLQIADYAVGVGKKGWETPSGSFQVIKMQRHPAWRHPITGKIFKSGAADNPLGDRWIGFWSDGKHQIGFHGTINDNLVGTAVSHGCLRMRNVDLKKLYNQVNLGNLVIVRH